MEKEVRALRTNFGLRTRSRPQTITFQPPSALHDPNRHSSKARSLVILLAHLMAQGMSGIIRRGKIPTSLLPERSGPSPKPEKGGSFMKFTGQALSPDSHGERCIEKSGPHLAYVESKCADRGSCL